MSEPCPICGSSKTRAGRRRRLYANRHGPVIAPSGLAVVLLALGCTLFAGGEWLFPTFRPELFVLGAVFILSPLALPFQYLSYQRAFYTRQRYRTCGHRWLVLTF
jgi:hypothetical protein